MLIFRDDHGDRATNLRLRALVSEQGLRERSERVRKKEKKSGGNKAFVNHCRRGLRLLQHLNSSARVVLRLQQTL